MISFKVCRCCLRENPARRYYIFDSTAFEGIDIDIGEGLRTALLTCAPKLNLAPDDGLSDVICDQCLLRVRDALAFRRRCEESELELKRRYADSERAIEEALRLVNEIYVRGKKAATDLDCAVGIQQASELGPTELAMLDDLLQLEEHNLERLLDSEMSAMNEKKLTQNAVKQHLNILNETSSIDSKSKKLTSDKQHSPGSPQYSDSSTSFTDCTSEPINDNTIKSLHSCSECEKKFTRKFQLKLHMISIHKQGDGLRYICNECQKTFASRHSLSYHQRSVHSDERPFQCTHCDRRFVLRTQLSSHLRIHTGEAKPRILKCLECGKRWPTKSDLRTHMRTHVTAQERPFKCDQCEKTFFTRGHLNSHLLVHSGEKPFTCPTCGKSYQCVGNLNNHMARQHDFERTLVRGRNVNVGNVEL